MAESTPHSPPNYGASSATPPGAHPEFHPEHVAARRRIEVRNYRLIVGTLMVVLICFGLLELLGFVHI